MEETSELDILTVDEAAQLLRIPPRAVREQARRGDLPARRLGRTWRFSRKALVAWVESGNTNAENQHYFLSIIAHELRTPLTTLKGYAQLLQFEIRNPASNDSRRREYIEDLMGQVYRFETLLQELLEAGGLQQYRLEPHREAMDLVSLASRVFGRFQRDEPSLPAHHFVFDAPLPVMGKWDANLLDQLLTILLTNAVQYSPSGGEIRLGVRSVNEHAELSVQDEGVGIVAGDQSLMFQPFRRGDGGKSSGSLGLGLYLASAIAQRHEGRIQVESVENEGSTFTVSLPFLN
jgi:excisionase family DNA binding protein